MRLSRCLVASDSNPDYVGFVDLVRSAWRDCVGIDLSLVLVASQLPPNVGRHEDVVTMFEPVPDVPTAFQAQCIRLLWPSMMRDDGAVIISDMDMAPLSRRYFTAALPTLPDDSFVVYRSGLLEAVGQLPICYNAARPGTWAEVFPGMRDPQDVRDVLANWWQIASPSWELRKVGNNGWTFDQSHLFDRVTAWSETKPEAHLVKLDDRALRFRRFHRRKATLGAESRLFPVQEWVLGHAIRRGYFTDSHLEQPPDLNARLNGSIVAHATGETARTHRGRR